MVAVFIILLASLFGPAVYYNYIFLFNFIVLVYFAVLKNDNVDAKYYLIVLAGGVMYLLKLFFFQCSEDFSWYLRLIQFISVLYLFTTFDDDSNLNYVHHLLQAYVYVCLIIGTLEILKLHDTNVLQFVSKYYWSEMHGNVRYRVKAINAGPGQFGLRMFLMNVYFGYRILMKKSTLLDVSVYFASSILIIYSYSRTSTVAAFLVFIVLFLFFSNKNKIITAMFLLLVPLFNLLEGFSFVRLERLADKGVAGDSSAIGRFEIWGYLFGKAFEYPSMVFNGWSECIFFKI